jgi:glycosyltransferase involved in cell wall biosynthesis
VAQVLKEADCGIQIEQGDAEKLAETLLWLSQDAEAVQRMGYNARCTLETEYSTACIAKKYYNVFTEIAGLPNKEEWPQYSPASSTCVPETKSEITAGKS